MNHVDEPSGFLRLGDNTWVWLGDLDRHEQTNVGVVPDERSLTVVDANFGWAAEKILGLIEASFDSPVSHVVNTHYHVDHSHGNRVFVERAGAAIVGGAGQREELLAKGQADSLVQLGSHQDEFFPASLEVSGVLRFPYSGLEVHSLAPAHTSSDVVVWVPSDSVLFVGDLAVAWEHGNNFSDTEADIPGWIAALDRCLSLQPRVVVPAHGSVSGPDILRAQRNFIEELWSLALQTAEHGQDSAAGDLLHALSQRHPLFAVAGHMNEMSQSMIQAAKRLRP